MQVGKTQNRCKLKVHSMRRVFVYKFKVYLNHQNYINVNETVTTARNYIFSLLLGRRQAIQRRPQHYPCCLGAVQALLRLAFYPVIALPIVIMVVRMVAEEGTVHVLSRPEISGTWSWGSSRSPSLV